ncbi:MAG: DUF4304 domain-containing protein [Brevundimonas sp.]|nr:DUF4304 domain-containing protein [Brevundimonas sp.]
MDSKAVSKEIREKVWPLLKDQGFRRFTTRSAWRYEDHKIDVVNFQSFNSYLAGALGVTSFSFTVNLGSFLTYVPPQWPLKSKDGHFMPHEAECHFRGSLSPTNHTSEPGIWVAKLDQAKHVPEGVWSVDERGLNLDHCIRDVAGQLPLAASWFSRLSDKSEVLRILLEDEEKMQRLWGFGRNPSPLRAYLTGYVARDLQYDQLARQKLAEAVSSRCFDDLFGNVEQAICRVA